MAEKASKALVQAAQIGSLQGVKAALEAGADIDHAHEISGFTTCTALSVSSFTGSADIVKLLLHKGASVNKRDGGSLSVVPLHVAATRGHIEVVDLLVHHGATLDIRDAYQRTPLMTACAYNQVGTVRRLIELGARVDLTDVRGQTVQSYCEKDKVGDRDFKEMQKLIQEATETKLLRCCNQRVANLATAESNGDLVTASSLDTVGHLCSFEAIFVQLPSKLANKSNQCSSAESTLKLCGQCKLTRYCSRDCQKQHWTVGHKKCCGHDAYTGETPEPFREVAKFIAGGLVSKKDLENFFQS
ncbi:Ankyrin-1 [Branchiostoma belcheri]|nr:Ankyrin-1 [Branchiostoma belcheri]